MTGSSRSGARRSALVFAGLLLLATAAAGLLAFRQGEEALQRELDRRLAERIESNRQIVEARLAGLMEGMELWARLPTMLQVLEGDPDREIQSILEVAQQTTPGIERIRCLDVGGLVVADTTLRSIGGQADIQAFGRAPHRGLLVMHEHEATLAVPVRWDFEETETLAWLEASLRSDWLVHGLPGHWVAVVGESGRILTAGGGPSFDPDPATLTTRSAHVRLPAGVGGSVGELHLGELTAEIDLPLRILSHTFSSTAGLSIALLLALFWGFLRRQERLFGALEVAVQSAEGASRAKSEFLARMSHEVRTPMNGVIGMAQLLSESPLTPQQDYHVDVILRSGKALIEIVNDVLDLSKIEAGALAIATQPFDVTKIVEEVAELFAGSARLNELTLACDVDDGLIGWVEGDDGRLRQVLANLVGNAVKFTERGGVRIRARREETARDDAAQVIRFEVHDTGPGIPEADTARVFEAFAQGDESATRGQGGTGLGLAISQRLVELMGGEIGLKSEFGRGSLFWFTLPLPACAVAPRPMAAVEPARRGMNSALLGARVLLAEDNPVNQEVGRGSLALLGCDVTVAETGREALRALDEGEYDIVLMDCHMPQMDGWAATLELRARELEHGKARVPVIALTADAMLGDRQRCLDSGMDDYLSKPFALEQLTAILELWLDPNAGARPVGAGAAPRPQRADASCIDPNALDQIRSLAQGSAANVVGRVIDSYLGSADAHLEVMRVALGTGDGDAACSAAQALKSAGGNVGAVEVSALCSEVAAACRIDELDHATALFSDLEVACEDARAALKSRRSELG